MPTSRAAFRVLVAEELGGGRFTALSTSGAGAAGGTTIVDSTLSNLILGNDYFNGYWAVLPSGPTGSGSYEASPVTDFVASTGTLTTVAFSAQVASGVTFELHQYDPAIIHTAGNEAIKSLFGERLLFLPVRDETLVTDNMLLNSDFETFAASNFTSWTLAGTGASVAESTTILWHGADAAAVTAGAGAAATYGQAINTSPGNAQLYQPGRGMFVFGAMVYATAADTARLQLTDGTDTNSSPYHTGEDGWEYLEVTLTPGSDIGTVTARLQVAASGVGRIDSAVVYQQRLVRYTVPAAIIQGPSFVSIQADRYRQNPPYVALNDWHLEEDGFTRYLILDSRPSSGYRLRLEGRNVLTAFTSTDTATTEVGSPQSRLLALKAAQIILERDVIGAPIGQAEGARQRAQEMERRFTNEATKPGLRMHQVVQVRSRSW